MIFRKWKIRVLSTFFQTYKSYKAWTRVSPFERQGFPPAGKSLPVLTTLSSRFSRGTMPALFRMAFSGIYQYPCPRLALIIHKFYIAAIFMNRYKLS